MAEQADSAANSIHQSVLLQEVIDGLNLRKGATLVDGTFGGGGHSAEICKRLGGATIIALDRDAGAWRRAKKKFADLDCRVSFHVGDFRNMDEALAAENVRHVDGVLLDIGLSSDQFENSGRGFSFMKDEPLLMTMKENPGPEDLTARAVVNEWDEENLAAVIRGYGEERYAGRIAQAIAEARKKAKIETTFALVRIIEGAVPAGYRNGRINCATRTFQAIRIAVNDELGALEAGLRKGFDALALGGRMAVITFHSLEDRIAKRFMRGEAAEGRGILITKKPITPGEAETAGNPRARSAKLRIIEKK